MTVMITAPPAANKRRPLSIDERKAKLDARITRERERISQLEKSRRTLDRYETRKERKARTRLLIQIGAEFSTLFTMPSLDEARHIVAALRDAKVPATLERRSAELSAPENRHAGFRRKEDDL